MARRALLLAAVVSLLLAADEPAKEEKEALTLPEGVVHTALPAGNIKWERIFKGGKPLLRVTVDKTILVARNVFIGDGKAATEYEAMKEGIHRVSVKGENSPVVGDMTWEGGTIRVPAGDFLPVDKLKAGACT